MKVSGKTVILFFIVIIIGMIASIQLVPYSTYGSLTTIVAITVTTAAISFIFSLLTGDYSWTDRLWSTSPIAYGWIYAYAGSFNSAVTLGALLVTLWGARLTFNFARRDGYSGSEDYRWTILHKKIPHPFAWTLFNLFFIALYQQLLFICFTLPLFIMSQNPNAMITIPTIIALIFVLAFLSIETIADQQQYEFQQAKYGLAPKRENFEEDYERGFRTSGLFSLSRHPNYFGELGVWWSIYLLGASTTPSLLHWSIVGPLLLTLLFIGSTVFTENITREKYPEYESYRKQVWPIIPKVKK
jgi:steroid 5-alpha reductase family enzyme